jgi:hypothetical protein
MKSISLAPYTVKVRPIYMSEDETVDKFSGENDLFEFVEQTVRELQQTNQADEANLRAITATTYKVDRRTICGIIEGGDFGNQGTLREITDGKVVHIKEPTHADMSPFYFLISLPKGRTKGILLIQRSGTDGVVTHFRDLLESKVKSKFEDERVHVESFTTRAIIQRYVQEAEIKEIQLVSYELPSDIANAVGVGHVENKGSAKLSINLRGMDVKGVRERIRSMLGEDATPSGPLVQLPSFPHDAVKFVMTLAGRRRTVKLTDQIQMRGEYDVTEQVTRDKKTRNPTFESIDKIAREILEDLETELYGVAGA